MKNIFDRLNKILKVISFITKYIGNKKSPFKTFAHQQPKSNQWKLYDPYENMSLVDLFIVRHLNLLSHIAGFSVAVAVWMQVASMGLSLSRIDNHQWWAIFPILCALAFMVLLHEYCHFMFCHWDQSIFLIAFNPGFIGIIYRGEYHKCRLILGALSPTVIITLLLFPAYLLDSPYCLLLVICNLAGSGSDWLRAYLTWKYIKTRIWIHGDQFYIPARSIQFEK